MAEEEGGGGGRGRGETPIPPPPPDAETEQHDRHTQSTNTIRMVSMVSRFREHGLKVTASTHIDGDEPLVTGKVIMALGSKDVTNVMYCDCTTCGLTVGLCIIPGTILIKDY